MIPIHEIAPHGAPGSAGSDGVRIRSGTDPDRVPPSRGSRSSPWSQAASRGATIAGTLPRPGIAVCTLIVILVATGAVAAQADPLTRCGAQGVALQVLGSGGPELQDQRASSSYLIWFNGRPTVLVDVGGGSALRFGQSGASVAPLEVVLLTHLHVDHTSDLPALVKSSFFEGRTDPLPLYGPAGNGDFPSTKQFVRTLFGTPSGAYRYLAEFVSAAPSDEYHLDAHNVSVKGHEIRPIYDSHGVRVVATAVIHGGVPALAYRVEIAGASIAFSGDTNGDGGNLARLARGVDLLVAHNAVRDGATGVERALHMQPSVIGRTAQEAAVKRLVLSHRMLRTLGHEEETEASIRTSFAGPVSFSNDLDCFAVP